MVEERTRSSTKYTRVSRDQSIEYDLNSALDEKTFGENREPNWQVALSAQCEHYDGALGGKKLEKFDRTAKRGWKAEIFVTRGEGVGETR